MTVSVCLPAYVIHCVGLFVFVTPSEISLFTSNFPGSIFVDKDVEGGQIAMDHLDVSMEEGESFGQLKQTVFHFHLVQFKI